MKEYRYSNNINWGKTFNQEDGMHHITASDDWEAYKKANRQDKAEHGLSFLQVKNEDGEWEWCQ